MNRVMDHIVDPIIDNSIDLDKYNQLLNFTVDFQNSSGVGWAFSTRLCVFPSINALLLIIEV